MRLLVWACVLILIVGNGRAQSTDLLVRGQILPVAPELLSGLWVAPDGRGGWLELRITIEAQGTLDGSGAKGPFLLEHVDVGLCSGPSPWMRLGQCNYMTTDAGGEVRFGPNLLKISAAAEFDFPGAEVDLRRDGDVWTGLFRRGKSVAQGALRRGEPGGLTGAWRSSDGDCLHIVETPREITAWLDRTGSPGGMHPARRTGQRPLLAQFGVMVGAERTSEGPLRFEIGGSDEGSAMAGGRTIYVRPRLLRRDGRRDPVLTGLRSSDGRWVEPDWVRVRGESCRGGR